MHDKPRIVVGLFVGLACVAVPLWYSLGQARGGRAPELQLPVGRSRCVEDTALMRSRHADLLRQWREAVVRDGQTTYVSKTFGETYPISLTKTCLGCHADRRAFCDRCHDYAGVRPRPDCWDCHVDSNDIKRK